MIQEWSYIQKLWMSRKKSVSLSVTINPRGPSSKGERIRSMRQYTASEVETIVKDEVTLSLEARIRVTDRRMLQGALEINVLQRCQQANVELVFTAISAFWRNRIECHFAPA